MVEQPATNIDLIELSTEIVCAYVSNNSLTPTEVTSFIQNVHSTLHAIETGDTAKHATDPKPAVSIKKSLTPDYIICLEDGKKFKSLKRHIRTHYDLSPEEYREKWGLPANYPMVAPNYSKVRSKLARANGLGKKDE